MSNEAKTVWGDFQGEIFTRTLFKNPGLILSGPTRDLELARPIIKSKIKQPKFWHYNLACQCESGELTCGLKPSSANWFRRGNMIGEVKRGDDVFGCFEIILD